MTLRLWPLVSFRCPRRRIETHPPAVLTPRLHAARLLVADDHPVNLEVMLRQLELLGLSADIAEDGAAALALWRNRRHAVVLLDLHMPVLDGFGLADAIRREEAKRDLPRTGLIAVTADALKGEDTRLFHRRDGWVPAQAHLAGRIGPRARPLDPGAGPDGEPGSGRPAGRLFDPEALRRLFGVDTGRLAALKENFADSATRDIAAIHAAANANSLRPSRTG